MEAFKNGERYEAYKEWDALKNTPYDYERKGLLDKIMSKRIAKSENKVLKPFLKYYEQCIVFMLKYVDELKYYKNFLHKNR